MRVLRRRERAITGASLIANIRLSTTTEKPNAKNGGDDNACQTAAYEVEKYAERMFHDRQLMEAAARIIIPEMLEQY